MFSNKIQLSFIVLIFSVIISGLNSCSTVKQEDELPGYWVWMNYRNGNDWDKIFRDLNDMGVGGMLLYARADDYPKVIPIAEKYGIDIHAWQWILNRPYGEIPEKHPEWLSVNRQGKSLAEEIAYVGYYKFLCPALPEVREYLVEDLEKIVTIEGLKGLSLDYCRFVDVILPEIFNLNTTLYRIKNIRSGTMAIIRS